jgi:general secretion pathway protein D
MKKMERFMNIDKTIFLTDSLRALSLLLVLALAGCVTSPPAKEPVPVSQGHIHATDTRPADLEAIPAPVTQTVFIPKPTPQPKLETYTISVEEVPVKELLFAIARDAQINLDVRGDISGWVTLNVVDRTLPQILERITNQCDIRYQINEDHLFITADKPFLRSYRVDYLNLDRESSSTIRTSTGINTGLDNSSGGSENNSSETEVINRTNHLFWDTLEENLEQIIYEPEPAPVATAAISQEASSLPALPAQSESQEEGASGNVIINRETGIVYVRATSRQHREVQGFLDQVTGSARRQVLIEATVAEVTLSRQHQLGVDWTAVIRNFNIQSNMLGPNLSSAPTFVLTHQENNSTMALRMLEEFGDVKVLSSPKIMALNNQTSLLKVVDNRIYFTISVEAETDPNTGAVTRTYETTPRSVPIGFIMNVTPFVTESEEIILNIRPTITRIVDFVNDPNPDLASANIFNRVPEVQIREMESVLRVSSGQTAIIGGLMQDSQDNTQQGVPWISRVPLLGSAFSYTDKSYAKSELVIFLRPTLIQNASIHGDLNSFGRFLPTSGN